MNHYRTILNSKKEIFVIVDANAFVHSSFHGYDTKPDAKGQDQKVLHGVLNALVEINNHLPRIDYLYVIFDPADGSLFRKSQFPAYKQNRPPTDPELVKQRSSCELILRDKLGIPMIHHPGYEADDIIGSLAELTKSFYQVVIVSPDKDLAQLVDDNVFLLRRWRSKAQRGYTLMDKDIVKEHFGVHPHQIPDWLALVGDTADNLPGLDKIGEKTAITILNEYPSIEHLMAVVHQLENKSLKQKVLQASHSLPLVKSLATIVKDLPIEPKIHEALNRSYRIRTHPDYHKTLLRLEKYFSWPHYYKGLFIPPQ